jgi:Rad3-related DNA helicase
VLWLDFW